LPLKIGVIKLDFQADGKQPIDNDKLYRYNKGTLNTNLQFEKKILGIMLMPGFVFELNVSNSWRTSVRFKTHKNKLRSE